jgi:hypothetical protein
MTALEERSWGEPELIAAIRDLPDSVSVDPPTLGFGADGMSRRSLPILPGADGELAYNLNFCEFFRHLQALGSFTYPLWVALATQLHRFGDEGHEMFHQLSALDARYSTRDTDLKWEQTKDMHPIRCDTLIEFGWRCPHLRPSRRCNGAKAPTYFVDHTEAEIL